MKTAVIARYQEDISWTKNLPPDVTPYVVQKGEQLPNIGRESLSYLWFITNFYDQLNGWYYFVQGDPFGHPNPPTFREERCPELFGYWNLTDEQGGPMHDGLPIAEFAAEAGITIDSYPSEFFSGAQFLTDAAGIRAWPLNFYHRLVVMHDSYDKAPWVMERLWNWLFLPPAVRTARS